MKEVPKELILETVKKNLRILQDEKTTSKQKKDIVCKFFSTGNLPSCQICLQNDEDIDSSTAEYIALMEKKPALTYSEELNRKITREKVPIAEIDFFGLNCDICHVRENCPLMQVNSMCAIDWGAQGEKKTPAQIVQFMIDIQYSRIAKARKFEEIDGGMPDENLSKELEKLRLMNEQLIELSSDKLSMKMELTAKSASGGGGLLQSIFGNMGNKTIDPNTQTIDIPSEPAEVKKSAKKTIKK